MTKIIIILSLLFITNIFAEDDFDRLIKKNNYNKILEKYQKSNLMKVRKDTKIIDYLPNKVLKDLKKIKKDKKTTYIKKYLSILPYSKKIHQKYLDLSWSNSFSTNSVDQFITYKNIFGYDQKYFNKLMFYNFNNLYKKDKNNKYIILMAQIDIEESTKMVEKFIKDKDYFLLSKLKNIPSLKIEFLKELIISDKFYYKKSVIEQFLKKSNKSELIKLYNNLSLNNKINIYFNYYKITKEEIDSNLINFLLKKESKNYHKVAFDIIGKLKLTQYTNYLIKFVSIYKAKCSSIRILLLSTLIELKPTFVINFLKKVDINKLNNIQKIKLCNFSNRLSIKQNCNYPEIISNSTEHEKELYLELILKQKREIPKYYLDNKNRYLSIFNDFYTNINKDTLKKIAYRGYKNGDYSLLLNYYSRLTFKELTDIKLRLTETGQSDIPKFVKNIKLGKDSLLKILMISLVKKDYYEIFNLKRYLSKNSINSVDFAKLIISVTKKEELFWLLRFLTFNISDEIKNTISENIIEVSQR